MCSLIICEEPNKSKIKPMKRSQSIQEMRNSYQPVFDTREIINPLANESKQGVDYRLKQLSTKRQESREKLWEKPMGLQENRKRADQSEAQM